MPEEWKDDAVILRLGYFREADIWARVLLRIHGMQTIFAFGAARSKRRFCGCMDVFNSLHCLIRVSRAGEFLNLIEADLYAGVSRLRTDWRAMGMAANCLLFAEACGVVAHSAAESFALLEDLRGTLERDGARSAFLPLFFRLRLAGALGLAPDFSRCGMCGADSGKFVFIAPEGRVFCANCAGRMNLFRAAGVFWLQAEARHFLSHIGSGQPSAWDLRSPSGAFLRQCAAAVDCFVQYHLGLTWENGWFRRI